VETEMEAEDGQVATAKTKIRKAPLQKELYCNAKEFDQARKEEPSIFFALSARKKRKKGRT
jgi:hypothetical protein